VTRILNFLKGRFFNSFLLPFLEPLSFCHLVSRDFSDERHFGAETSSTIAIMNAPNAGQDPATIPAATNTMDPATATATEDVGVAQDPGHATTDDHDVSKAHRNVVDHARLASGKEQTMTLMQGLRLYPKAIAFSVIISTCIVMEGYDISLVTNFCKLRS
jgi:hypothetical protein